MVKKNSIAYVIFSYVVGFTSSRGRHSHRFKRNLFTPPVNIPRRLLKARGSRDLDKYHASDTHFRALQMVTHTHTHTLLQNQTDFRSRLRQLNELLRYFVSSVLCRSFHKSYRCVCVAYSTSRIADLFKSADKQVKAF